MAMDDDGEVGRSILGYLRSHPRAADTLCGIVNWWLPRQRLETGFQHIEHVLDELVKTGQLDRHPLPDGEVLYAMKTRTGKRPSC